ncbi:hypothetical protein E2320_012595, partial [Naja naja]
MQDAAFQGNPQPVGKLKQTKTGENEEDSCCKADQDVICLMDKNFVRIGKWFIRPYEKNEKPINK